MLFHFSLIQSVFDSYLSYCSLPIHLRHYSSTHSIPILNQISTNTSAHNHYRVSALSASSIHHSLPVPQHSSHFLVLFSTPQLCCLSLSAHHVVDRLFAVRHVTAQSPIHSFVSIVVRRRLPTIAILSFRQVYTLFHLLRLLPNTTFILVIHTNRL